MFFDAFNYLGYYLGGWGTTLLATLFYIAMARIGVAFVLKLFRFNADYKPSGGRGDGNNYTIYNIKPSKK